MPYLFIICLSFWLSPSATVTQWEIYDIELNAQEDHGWWEFPAKAVFSHPDGTRITLDAFYDGERKWIVRFAPP